MKKIFDVAMNDLSISFRERGIWLNLVVLPIVFILIIGVVNGATSDDSNNNSRILLDVLDADSTLLSAQFLESLRQANPRLVLCPMDNNLSGDMNDICGLTDGTLSAESALERLTNGTVRATLEIPAGFESSVLEGTPINIVYRSDIDPLQPDFLVQSVQVAVQRVSGASVAAQVGGLAVTTLGGEDESAFRERVYAQAAQIWAAQSELVVYRSSGATSDGNDNLGFRQSVPGMGSMYVMFTVLVGAVLLLQERKQWTLQRLVMMPVSRTQVIGGKIAARFVMGMIQYAVAFGFGMILGVSFGNQWAALLLMMIAFVACISAITFLLATLIQTEMQANGIITFFVLTTAPLGGAWWPLEIVPPFMQNLAMLTPMGWAMRGFGELLFYGGGLADVLLPVSVLLGVAVVCFGVAVARFRYE